MPMQAGTTDQASTAPPYADVLANNKQPALNATSDMPPREPPVATIDVNGAQAGEEAAPVDNDAKPDKTDGTSGAETKTEGEGDGVPTKTAGEEGDKTSPQQRAAFARERNRRQAAEQATAELRTQVAQLAQSVAKLTGATEAKEDPRPTRDAFDSPDAYDKALETWAGRRATEVAKAEVSAANAKQEQDRQVKELVDSFKERQTKFEADHPDFEDVVYADDVKISPAMSQAILEAEDGPAVAYYLGQNPEVAERIAGLRPAAAVYEIGKISSKLSTPPRPKPEPIRPLANRNSAGPKSPDEMSMEEYAAHRAAKAN